MHRRLLAAVCALAVMAAGCGGGGKPSARSAPAEGSRAQTNVERLAAETDDRGYITSEAALQLFALLYGPLPGVTPPAGGPGIEVDGSLAITGVMRHWADLTADQQRAVRTALGLPDGFAPLPDASGRARPGTTTIPPPSTFTAELKQVLSLLAAHLGPLATPVELRTTPPLFPGSKALADALIYAGDKGKACYVRLFPSAYTATNVLISTLAHELMHCYQQEWGPRPPGWIEEGMAEWAGATIAAEAGVAFDPTDQKYVTAYTTSPEKPLFTRAYDAVGWFVYVAQSGVDLWPRLKSISTAPFNRAAYDAATAGLGESFIEGWAPAQFDFAPWAGRWELTGPGIPPSSVTPKFSNQSVKNGSKVEITAPKFAAARKAMTFDAEVTLITAAATTVGLDRINGTEDRALRTFTGFQCTRDDGVCVCPPDTEQAGMTFPALSRGPHFFAASGGPEVTSVTVLGFSLKDACNAKSCLIGTWTNSQTPMVKGIDGLKGGTGSVLTIDPAGNVTLDYAAMTPFTGDAPGGTFDLTVRGVITAKITIPPGVDVSAPVPFTNAQLTGASGTGSLNVGGFIVPIDEVFVQGILSFGNGGSGTNFGTCSGDSLTLSSGSGSWTYERVG